MRYERSTSSFLERDRRIQETGNLLEEEGSSFSLAKEYNNSRKNESWAPNITHRKSASIKSAFGNMIGSANPAG